MITITVHDHDDGVLVAATGHADSVEGDDTGSLVCAGCSLLLATALQVMHGDLHDGSPGHVPVTFPAAQLQLAEYVVEGLQLIAETYTGYVIVYRNDTRLRAQRRSP